MLKEPEPRPESPPLPPYEPAASPEEAALVINTLALRHDEHAYLIGRHLEDQKQALGYRRYGEWLKENVRRCSEGTARTYRRYAEACLKEGRLLPFSSAVRTDIKRVEDLVDPSNPDESHNWDYYTPVRFIDAAHRVMSRITLDPASSAAANDRLGIQRIPLIFTIDGVGGPKDGLSRPWLDKDGRPSRIFCNPPYCGMTPRFAKKLLEEHEAGRVEAAIILVNLQTAIRAWFQDLAALGSICLPVGQIKDWEGPDAAKGVGPWGSVFVYLGPDDDRFANEFGRFGLVGMMGRASAAPEQVAA